MGPPGAGKTAIVAALAGELLWRDEHRVLVDTANPSPHSLSAWVEAGRLGVFDDVPHDVSFEVAASICRTVRLSIYVRRRSNDHDGEGVTAGGLENLVSRNAFRVLYNGLTREDSLRALRSACCHSGIGSFAAALSERVAYRTGRYTGRPPAFQSAGSRIARAEVARLADAIDRHFWQIALIDRWQAEFASP